jgi:acyl carrier protein|tara:strand:- start:1716 stop:1952 length:237 start_codon:yes stop_codon:yes gene_type:complete
MDNVKKYDQAFVETFSIKKKLLNNLEYNKIEQWDSIGHMTLISNLEDKFKITFETDDVVDFSSYKTGKEILKKYNINI